MLCHIRIVLQCRAVLKRKSFHCFNYNSLQEPTTQMARKMYLLFHRIEPQRGYRARLEQYFLRVFFLVLRKS